MYNKPSAEGVGYPSRDENLDVLKGFVNPPQGYGEVAFYWWLGDPLRKERIEWQLDRLKDKGVCGLQVNYAHSDKGGRTYGLTYPSEPPLFSDNWWDLFCWFLKQAKKRGMSVSLSDYTLGVAGQGWYIDEIINKNPSICGETLEHKIEDIEGNSNYSLELPENILSAAAYKLEDGSIIPDSVIDLRNKIINNTLQWNVPEGKWRIIVVFNKVDPLSLDPMNPLSGAKVIETFFQRFEDRNPGESGKGLNFFFSDELQFGVVGTLWNDSFADEFIKRKGYDIIPVLSALFVDIGAITPKIRLDYWDVQVQLEEEYFFRPIYEWHEKRGMLYGCDHGGRGTNVVEFGDYYRTQRWMPCPGNDSPNLSADVIKNKVASSITHLYQRPRTWLEGYHSSGWGTSTAQVADATFRNFVMGHNMLSLHGLYYSTHGGWWEWAPPCNHFRMPYWNHIEGLLKCAERLSYLLSQGIHCCDVAVMYPVEPVQAGIDGSRAVQSAFNIANYLYNQGIDFDFMDSQSLARAEVKRKELHVSGEKYRVLILPAMKAVRHLTIQKVLEFHQAGGIVIAMDCLPEANDRVGYDDPELHEMVKQVFGITAKDAIKELKIHSNNSGGMGILTHTWDQTAKIINDAFPRDFVCLSDLPEKSKTYVLHRRIGKRDVYMVYGVPKGSECFFRSSGKVEFWDPWTGMTQPLDKIIQISDGTKVFMPLEQYEAQLIVFDSDDQTAISKNIMVIGDISDKSEIISLDGQWEFELKPTMDNTWGDYRLPAFDGMIGAEARIFKYMYEPPSHPNWQDPKLDDSEWKQVTYSFGPYFWKLGPLPDDVDFSVIENQLANLKHIDSASSIEINGKNYFWKPYDFSMRLGVEGDPGHQGYHGLKGKVTDDFIALGKMKLTHGGSVYEKEDDGSIYYLWTSVFAENEIQARVVNGEVKPTKFWLDSVEMESDAEKSKLNSGSNPLLLRYDQPCRTHFILESAEALKDWKQTYPLAMRWYNNPGVIKFDIFPQENKHAGWYRFTAPPGLRSMIVACYGKIKAYADGNEMDIKLEDQRDDGVSVYKAILPKPASAPSKVAIRIEQESGYYGGSVLPEPITLDCVKGLIELDDWSKIDGLSCYSGGARYRKNFEFSLNQTQGQVILNLGNVVSTAEVHINGNLAGIKVAPPWKFDISDLVKQGENLIEILIYNTLANHYLTIPTRYRGSLESGLIGPVNIEVKS
jgi:hypothetical protein